MEYYPTLITLHIIFAGGWLMSLLTDGILKKLISNKKNSNDVKIFISLYLKITNLFGIIGAIGILLTGIVMVLLNPGYGFFDMSANHWLATKQILMVILLLIIFVFIIPTAKKIRNEINTELASGSQISEDTFKLLSKIYKLNMAINIIVVLNFLFAITHRYIG
ncbi:MAG: hypothetical protein KGZ42_11605 [Melioribacter sp.]|nr:hypothetical protein [Melioribacter sp.]